VFSFVVCSRRDAASH
jgi:hypothetical protein